MMGFFMSKTVSWSPRYSQKFYPLIGLMLCEARSSLQSHNIHFTYEQSCIRMSVFYQQILCVCVYQEISSCGWKYVYFPHTFEGFFCKWKMEPGVGRKPEHREGSPTGFGIEKKMWRVQPASLFSQASQSISIGTADTPPFFWPGTSKKIAEISKAKQKKHIHFQLQRSPPLKFKFPTPFPYNLIEVRLPILADLQRHTPSIFFVNFLGVKRNFQPKIRAEKGRVYVPKTLHCLSEMGKGMFPKDVNIAIIWDLDMSKNSEW